MNRADEFTGVHIVDHPLVQVRLTRLRDSETLAPEFRRILRELGGLLGYEITRNLAVKKIRVRTPVAETSGIALADDPPAVVPILRAGLVLAEGVTDVLPNAAMGHIGLYRDEGTHEPVEYMVKLPPAANRDYFLVDPMFATGGSAIHAVQTLESSGVALNRIIFLALVAAPEGIQAFRKKYADIPIFLAAIDDRLNESAFIVPGLGDAGDRLFGT